MDDPERESGHLFSLREGNIVDDLFEFLGDPDNFSILVAFPVEQVGELGCVRFHGFGRRVGLNELVHVKLSGLGTIETDHLETDHLGHEVRYSTNLVKSVIS